MKKVFLLTLALMLLLSGCTVTYESVVKEKGAVSFNEVWYTGENQIAFYNMQSISKWDKFVENCKSNKPKEVTVAHIFDVTGEGGSMDIRKLKYDGDQYTLTCDSHYYVLDGEQEAIQDSCPVDEPKERTFKYLKEFDVKADCEYSYSDTYRYYVLTNIQGLTAEEFSENRYDSESEISQNSYLAFVKELDTQE